MEIIADRTRLRQVMINLVNNAIKFTEQGEDPACATAQEDEHVLIRVKDTGIGIPPDKLEMVFQEFTQVDTSTTRKAGGTGLGLPISRSLVEMHGGRLWAESTGVTGEGSTFYRGTAHRSQDRRTGDRERTRDRHGNAEYSWNASSAASSSPTSPLCRPSATTASSQWLEARYDYDAFKREILRGLPGRPFNLWRYQDILPLENPAALDLYPAGGTPLWLSQRFAPALGIDHVYIKDERYGPTSSFKDRQAAVAVAAMNEGGVREAVIASTGNAAVAYAAACARAGIKLWVFMTSLVPQEKLREAALFGAEVIRVSGNYDQTKQIAAQFAERRHLLLDRGASSIPARESMKTIAYEIVEQLGWRAPDWYIQSVSGGLGPAGRVSGLQGNARDGVDRPHPQTGRHPGRGLLADGAGLQGRARIPPSRSSPIRASSSCPPAIPGRSYTYLWNLTQQYGGTMESVTDAEAFACHALPRQERGHGGGTRRRRSPLPVLKKC